MNRNAIRNRDQNFIHKWFPLALITTKKEVPHIFMSAVRSHNTSSFLIIINNQRTESAAVQRLDWFSSFIKKKIIKNRMERTEVGVFLTLHFEIVFIEFINDLVTDRVTMVICFGLEMRYFLWNGFPISTVEHSIVEHSLSSTHFGSRFKRLG